METLKKQCKLLHWADDHKIVEALQRDSSIDLKGLTMLEKLFKKIAESSCLDEGINEIREMLDQFFEWSLE